MPNVTRDAQGVSRETLERLRLFAAEVERWNPTINLVAAADIAFLWHRHIQDSLQLARLMPACLRSAVDLGSGGGFPGLVLAIVTDTAFHLVESDKRKAAFLRHATYRTNTLVTVHACRIEQCGLRDIDFVTSRALAPLSRLLTYAVPLLAPHGVCLFLTGKNTSAELERASSAWRMRVARLPNSVREGEVLRIDEIEHV